MRECLTFNDVLLVPAFSEILPSQVNVKTKLTKKISLNIPIMSAAMDTVTEFRTAIALAREGGIGIIHKNMSLQEQAQQVKRVKKSESLLISDPVTVRPDQKLSEAFELMRKYDISGLPVVKDGFPVGILTHRDVRFERDMNRKVSELMTAELVTAKADISQEECKALLHRHRIEKLIIINRKKMLAGMVTVKDMMKAEQFPLAAKDDMGRLLVGAAIGVGNEAMQRAEQLLAEDCDLLVVDTAHGHTKNVIDTLRLLRKKFPDCGLVGGNVATAEGARAVIRGGADVIKVGIGPGSICTTRVVAGVGVPQLTAIMDCAGVAGKLGATIIADGGIKYSGDVTKALAAGADCTMMGSLFAGTDESPGELVIYQGRTYKVYRGMGSISAMKEGSRDRYGQEGVEDKKLVPEGVEGQVPYRGTLSGVVAQLVGGAKSGMAYLGCKTIKMLQKKAAFIRITSPGLIESHVHDVLITREAPNYRAE
ncbi:MAG: IMP dehydrogenase [Pseudomonadota bacterium]